MLVARWRPRRPGRPRLMPIFLAVMAACSPSTIRSAARRWWGSAPRSGGRLPTSEAFHVGLRPAQAEQGSAQIVSERDRRVGRGVHATGRRDLVAAMAMPSAAEIAACRPSRRPAAGRTPGVRRQAELPRTHSRIRLKSRLCLSTAPMTMSRRCPAADRTGRQTVENGGEHVLVRRLGVGAVGPRERNSVSAEDGDTAASASLCC